MCVKKGVSECVAVVQIIAGGERWEIAGVESRCISSWREVDVFVGVKWLNVRALSLIW